MNQSQRMRLGWMPRFKISSPILNQPVPKNNHKLVIEDEVWPNAQRQALIGMRPQLLFSETVITIFENETAPRFTLKWLVQDPDIQTQHQSVSDKSESPTPKPKSSSNEQVFRKNEDRRARAQLQHGECSAPSLTSKIHQTLANDSWTLKLLPGLKMSCPSTMTIVWRVKRHLTNLGFVEVFACLATTWSE